jgi:hypothetical protein
MGPEDIEKRRAELHAKIDAKYRELQAASSDSIFERLGIVELWRNEKLYADWALNQEMSRCLSKKETATKP